MTTATLQKGLKKVIETQKRFEAELELIKKAVDEHVFEDVRPEYLKKLSKINAEMDKGKGTRFKSRNELKKFFDELRT